MPLLSSAAECAACPPDLGAWRMLPPSISLLAAVGVVTGERLSEGWNIMRRPAQALPAGVTGCECLCRGGTWLWLALAGSASLEQEMSGGA